MSTNALARKLSRIEFLAGGQGQATSGLLESLRGDTGQFLSKAVLTPDEWQQKLLASSAMRVLLLCGRQTGKSTVAGALALQTALLRANPFELAV